MYTSYFGLEDKPFSIAPNPDYLFMSDRHREALNHLTYGLGDTGGFVLLTGEVGTGKTTISRRLMENLPENTQAAFILNPTLSSQELLATICDELKIRYRKTGATLKTLTDKIQQKLIKNHDADINTLLIIDEAQHLQPEVLEQLRLLTNLETNTKKLLQVILIGQPELQQLLKRRDLRQLAQRITARYHLLPLNKQEVEQYLKHRLSVAQCFRNIFDKRAVSAIHSICKGIPRLMNLLAERSLINAYNSNNAVVNRKIVLAAAYDALGDEFELKPWWQKSAVKITLISLVMMGILATGIWWGVNSQQILLSTPKSEEQVIDKAHVDNSATLHTTTVPEPVENPVVSNDNKLIQQITDTTHSNEQPVSEAQPVLAQSLPPVQERESIKEPMIANGQRRQVEQQAIEQSNIALEQARNTDFSVSAEDGVSEELLARFQSAIDDTKLEGDSLEEQQTPNQAPVKSLHEMPTWVQDGIPSLQFEMHIFASDGQGWVRVNGRDRYEGDYIGRELLLNEIQPQQVVLSFRGEKFSMAALSSWN